MPWSPCLWETDPWCLGWFAEKLLVPALLALVVYNLTVRQLKKKREIDFAEKQLAEFYAPMLGARAEILNHTKFDQYMTAASRREDKKRLARDAKRPIDYLLLGEQKNYETELERFFDNINNRLLNDRIDAYIKMRELFASKMAYADVDTRHWYDYFYAFVEMWRVLRDNRKANPPFLPQGVGSELGAMFDEEKLQPFYEHLRERCDYLQNEIAGRYAAKTAAPTSPQVERRNSTEEE